MLLRLDEVKVGARLGQMPSASSKSTTAPSAEYGKADGMRSPVLDNI